MQLGNLIRDAREAAGMTREDVIVNVRLQGLEDWTERFSTNTLLNWESGETKKIDTLALPLLAVAMQLDPDYFFEKIIDAFVQERAAAASRARASQADLLAARARHPRGGADRSKRRTQDSKE